MLRPPHISLRPFVKDVWVSDHTDRPKLPRFRENSLPDGQMHVVIRLSGGQIRIIDAAHPDGHNYGYGVIGGARATFYTREVFGPARSIGATLRPGAAQALFGASAMEFANRHTSLDDVWGLQANLLRERLVELARPELQLELFEMHLMTRLPQVKGIHPAIAHALADLNGEVRDMVTRSGLSHRRFIELFGRSVGLTPKRFVRVQRFQRMLKLLGNNPRESWANVALDAGYTDQAHFNHEFREFAGVTPEQYKRVAPTSPGHVLVMDAKIPDSKKRDSGPK